VGKRRLQSHSGSVESAVIGMSVFIRYKNTNRINIRDTVTPAAGSVVRSVEPTLRTRRCQPRRSLPYAQVVSG